MPWSFRLSDRHIILQKFVVAARLNFRQIGREILFATATETTHFLGLETSLS